jgi:cyanophycin synthetase
MLHTYKLTHSQLNSFLLEYEARKLGLTCTRINHYVLIVSDNNGKQALFRRAAGPYVSYAADIVAMNKDLSKRIWHMNQVPINPWISISHCEEDILLAEQFAEKYNWEIVVKPIDGAGGRNVYTKIETKKDLIDAINGVNEARVTNTRYLGPNRILVERKFDAPDYRFFIVNGRVEGILERIRPHVIGDGKQTIAALLQEKVTNRATNPDLQSRPLKMDDEVHRRIAEQGYGYDDVLPDQKTIILRGNANLSTGGESIDLTDKVGPNIKSLVERAVMAIPNLSTCGVDVLAKDLFNETDLTNSAIAINEIESDAAMCMHHFPVFGQPRNIAGKILAQYFDLKKVDFSNYEHDFSSHANLVDEIIQSIRYTYFKNSDELSRAFSAS